jgi:hypothetical protein
LLFLEFSDGEGILWWCDDVRKWVARWECTKFRFPAQTGWLIFFKFLRESIFRLTSFLTSYLISFRKTVKASCSLIDRNIMEEIYSQFYWTKFWWHAPIHVFRFAITSGLGNREHVLRDPLCWPRNALYPERLALTSPTSSGRSVGIVRSRTKATKFVVCLCLL